MKIAIGQVSHETNTFSAVPTTVEAFRRVQWNTGEKMRSVHTDVRDYLGGMIDQARESGTDLIPTFAASAYPSGTITSDAFESLIATLRKTVTENARDADAFCLSLHGAGVANGIDDLEYEVLKAVRDIVGYSIPVVATLDLHANLTAAMLREADVFLGVKLYPHVDSYERGRQALELARLIAEGSVKPVMRAVQIPFLMPLSTTNLPPASSLNKFCRKQEKRHGVVDCTLLHGFPYSDVPGVGTSVVAITNDDEDLALEAATEVARAVWDAREGFVKEFPSPVEGVRRAMQAEHHPVVVNETSDNPGGGTPGDGTRLLEAMIRLRSRRACFAVINDPEVARAAHCSGVGATINVLLGGKADSMHGEPLQVEAYVRGLTDGRYMLSTPMNKGRKVNLGLSALLQIEGVDVVVGSANVQVLDEQIFLLHGIDVNAYDIVALKSSHHFRAVFEALAAEIITVDSPGLSTSRLDSFDFTRVPRPVFPLDTVEKPSFEML